MQEDTEGAARWQPVMMCLRDGHRRGQRIECSCGALAVIIIGTVCDYGLTDASNYCQDCYLKAQQEEIEKL